jgi:cytochrome c biogenesis protein CcmG, thiol:disulfide interchange protein DsbE
MKKISTLLFFLFPIFVFSQAETKDTAAKAVDMNGRTIPSVNVTTLDGGVFNTAGISNNGKPVVINFWATWCAPCKRELNTIAEMYDEWQEKTGVKLIAISIDDSRNMGKVAPYVNGQGWDYEVYIDPNSDFRRALNVNNVPHTFLVNGKNEIVWQHNSYAPGDEDHLFELIQKVAKGEAIDK